MQVVSFDHGKPVDGQQVRHLLMVSSDIYTRCGLRVCTYTARWNITPRQYIMEDDITGEHMVVPPYALDAAIRHHVTCKNCLRPYKEVSSDAA